MKRCAGLVVMFFGSSYWIRTGFPVLFSQLSCL